MQPFSAYLPEQLSATPADDLTPEARQQLITAYARHFNMSEEEVARALDTIVAQTKSTQYPGGILPNWHNLRQPDIFEAAYRRPTRADQVLSLYDQAIANISGAGQVVPYAREAAMPMFTAIGYPVDWVMDKARGGIEAATGKELPDNIVTNLLAPMAVYTGAPRVWDKAIDKLSQSTKYPKGRAFARGVQNFSKNHPTINKVLHPWNSYFGKYVRHPNLTHAPIRSAVGKMGWGGAVDVATTGANTGYDVYENLNGQKSGRYTQATRDAIGHNASPWQAARTYQGKRLVDQALDHAKLALLIASKGRTHGLLTVMGGGARLHTENIPFLGNYDPLLMGRTNKNLITDAIFNPTMKGSIARRKLKHRWRDGFSSGLGKTLAGEYFNYEHDAVDRKIADERRDFRNMADFYTMAYNPKLADKLLKAREESAAEKALLRKRNEWMRDTKVGAKNKTIYDTAAKQVDADTSTLV